jgi:hypothetical protein
LFSSRVRALGEKVIPSRISSAAVVWRGKPQTPDIAAPSHGKSSSPSSVIGSWGPRSVHCCHNCACVSAAIKTERTGFILLGKRHTANGRRGRCRARDRAPRGVPPEGTA